jgi:hypothetical protein
MKTLIKKLWSSFDNSPGGFSARKLSAFVAVVVVSAKISYQFTTAENLVEVLIVWLTFAAVCLGLVTGEQLIKLRNGKDVTVTESASSTTTIKTETP